MPRRPVNQHLSALAGYGCPIFSTSTHQYGVRYTGTPGGSTGIVVGKRARGGAWNEHTLSGAALTALNGAAIPDDEHNYASIIRSGNGVLHLFANMHNDALRYVTATDTGTDSPPTSWSAGSLPTTGAGETLSRYTYPLIVECGNGDLLCFMRAGPTNSGSGRANWYVWRYVSGAWGDPTRVLDGMSPDTSYGSDSATNYSAYPTQVYCEPSWSVDPGRLHIAWTWRRYGSAAAADAAGDGSMHGGTAGSNFFRGNYLASYMRSDDHGATWKTILGASVTLPIKYDTSDGSGDAHWGVRCLDSGGAEITGGSAGWYNGGGLIVDDQGYPVIAISSSPWVTIAWNGAAWVKSEVATELATYALASTHLPFVFGGNLWVLGTTSEQVLGSDPLVRHIRLFRWDNTGGSVRMSHEVPIAWDGSWVPNWDRGAWAKFRSVETLVPDGDRAFLVYAAGAHGRMKAA